MPVVCRLMTVSRAPVISVLVAVLALSFEKTLEIELELFALTASIPCFLRACKPCANHRSNGYTTGGFPGSVAPTLAIPLVGFVQPEVQARSQQDAQRARPHKPRSNQRLPRDGCAAAPPTRLACLFRMRQRQHRDS